MLELRQATLEDALLIHKLAKQVFPETYKHILSPEQNNFMFEWMYSVENIRKQLLDGHCYFICMANEEDCGYMSIQQVEDHVYYLHKIYVLPQSQQSGAGRYLFEQALTYIRSIHPDPCRMELHVNRNNPAIGFYTKMGMSILRSGDFDIGNGYYMNDYIMSFDLL